MIASLRYFLGVALIATGMSIMIRYGFISFPEALPGRIGGLVNVLLGAWFIRRSFK